MSLPNIISRHVRTVLGHTHIEYEVQLAEGNVERFSLPELLERYGEDVKSVVTWYDDWNKVERTPEKVLEAGLFKVVNRGYTDEFAEWCTRGDLGPYGFLVVEFNAQNKDMEIAQLRKQLQASRHQRPAHDHARCMAIIASKDKRIHELELEVAKLRSLDGGSTNGNNGGRKGRFKPGMCGFKNYTGQICYLNAAMQVVVHVDALLAVLPLLGNLNPMTVAVQELSERVWSGRYKMQEVRKVYGCLPKGKFPTKVRGITMHHDTSEVLSEVLDLLHEGSNNRTHPEEQQPLTIFRGDDPEAAEKAWEEALLTDRSPIMDTTWGLEGSCLRCTGCGTENLKIIHYTTLSLPMVPLGATACEEDVDLNIERCFNYWMEMEPIKDWMCPTCQEKKPATKQLRLCKLPPVLILVLKRFIHDEKGTAIKLHDNVTFPLEGLDLRRYLPSDTGAIYDLQATIRHQGSTQIGHYITQALVKGKWVQFNDEKVKPIDTVSCGGAKPEEKFNPYVLVYQRRGHRVAEAKDVENKEDEDDVYVGADDDADVPEPTRIMKKMTVIHEGQEMEVLHTPDGKRGLQLSGSDMTAITGSGRKKAIPFKLAPTKVKVRGSLRTVAENNGARPMDISGESDGEEDDEIGEGFPENLELYQSPSKKTKTDPKGANNE